MMACKCLTPIDLLIPGGKGETYTVKLQPHGGDPVVVRLTAASAVEASLKASYEAQAQLGVVGIAIEARVADRAYWEGLVDAYLDRQHDCPAEALAGSDVAVVLVEEP